MNTLYRTSGVLPRPLITIHTLRDQQVPYIHEPLYAQKTQASGALLTRHLPIAIDRFEHCNFTEGEALAVLLMLFYDNAIESVSGVASFLPPNSSRRSRPAHARLDSRTVWAARPWR